LDALTHSSFANENKVNSYERLEFLGDSVLSFIVSEHLFGRFDFSEGELSKIRARIVCENSLRECAERLGLANDMRLSKGEEQTGGKTRASILADVFEAVLAAIYIDGGIEATKKFVFDNLANTIQRAVRGEINTDYKTMLQEAVQNINKEAKYVIISEEGAEHNKIFTAELTVDGISIGRGRGKTKKEAEQNAAHTWFQKEDRE